MHIVIIIARCNQAYHRRRGLIHPTKWSGGKIKRTPFCKCSNPLFHTCKHMGNTQFIFLDIAEVFFFFFSFLGNYYELSLQIPFNPVRKRNFILNSELIHTQFILNSYSIYTQFLQPFFFSSFLT